MKFEQIKELLDYLIEQQNVGFTFYDIQGKIIIGFADQSGDTEIRNISIYLEDNGLKLHLRREDSFLDFSEEIHFIQYKLLGRIVLAQRGFGNFIWKFKIEKDEKNGKDKLIYYSEKLID